eukprot:13636040-Alexandrium_andersonii.AAC.1
MAEVAKGHANENLAKKNDMKHADSSEKANTTTRSNSVRAMLKPSSSEKGAHQAPTTQNADTS